MNENTTFEALGNITGGAYLNEIRFDEDKDLFRVNVAILLSKTREGTANWTYGWLTSTKSTYGMLSVAFESQTEDDGRFHHGIKGMRRIQVLNPNLVPWQSESDPDKNGVTVFGLLTSISDGKRPKSDNDEGSSQEQEDFPPAPDFNDDFDDDIPF